jgi:hypothetical protein
MVTFCKDGGELGRKGSSNCNPVERAISGTEGDFSDIQITIFSVSSCGGGYAIEKPDIVVSTGLTCNTNQTPVKRLRTPYQTPEYPHGEGSGTRTCSTQICCLDIFTARPFPPAICI